MIRTPEEKQAALDNYQELVNEIFGEGVVCININKDPSLIAYSLNHEGDFENFKAQYRERLLCLKTKFEKGESYNNLLNKIKDVAYATTWEGAYAELAAYDILLFNQKLNCHMILDVEDDASKSFAEECGVAKMNEDIYFDDDQDAYADVKILKDVVNEILSKIINDVLCELGIARECCIMPEYPLDTDYSVYQQYFNDLKRELKVYMSENRIESGRCCFASKIIHSLTYRIAWNQRSNTSESSYCPFRQAQNIKNVILKRYTKKFTKDTPFMLVFVKFPWYNLIVSDFGGMNAIFYRALARRTFCQYLHDDIRMNQIYPHFTGDLSAMDVSRKISGILFLEDEIIKKSRKDYGCFFYMNPNADHPLPHALVSRILHEVLRTSAQGEFDDFQFDNY